MRAPQVGIGFIVCVLASPLFGQTAGMKSFQGSIKDVDGNRITGVVDLEFRIYDAEVAGTLVDMDGNGMVEDACGKDVTCVSALSVTDGILSTKFGPIHPKVFDGTQRWLEVRVDGTPLSLVEIATASATAEQLNIPKTGTPAMEVEATTGQVGIGVSPDPTKPERLQVASIRTSTISSNSDLVFRTSTGQTTMTISDTGQIAVGPTPPVPGGADFQLTGNMETTGNLTVMGSLEATAELKATDVVATGKVVIGNDARNDHATLTITATSISRSDNIPVNFKGGIDLGPSDCCSPHLGGGCDDATCQFFLCGGEFPADPTCCTDAWDAACVELARNTWCVQLCALKNLSVSGFLTVGDNSFTMNGATDTITASSGTISFDDENLVTTGRMSVGTTSLGNALFVEDNINNAGASILSSHVALIRNANPNFGSDVLALQVAQLNPGNISNFITFFDANGNSLGSIQGNGVGVELGGPGSDYAEWLTKLHPEETFDSGDIVGVVGGKITKDTQGAHHVMVISSGSIVAGNRPADEHDLTEYEKVAFIGQVPLKVRGPVRLGDLIVPSGDNDGVGVAVSPTQIAPDRIQRAVGQAWEASTVAGVKKVNVLVGVHPSPFGGVALAAIQGLHEIAQEQGNEIETLRTENAATNARVAALEEALGNVTGSSRASMFGLATPALAMMGLLGLIVIVIGRSRRGAAR